MPPMWAAATDAQPTGAAFDIVLILHVLCVVIGGGTAIVAAIEAARLQRVTSPDGLTGGLRTYYSGGFNWAARTLWGVPVFGFALLAMSHGEDRLGQAWVLIGLALWLVAAGIAESVLWPEERRLAHDLSGWAAPATPDPGAAADVGGPAWRHRCATVLWSATVVVAVLVVASMLMVVRP
jgi:hypothetical protein